MVKMLPLIKQTFGNFLSDKAPQMAAAIAYATIFALPPLLLLLLALLGVFVDPHEFSGRIVAEVRALIGPEGAELIGDIIASANRPGGGVMAAVGAVMLVVGATGAFVQLQDALNAAWRVKPDPAQGGLQTFVAKRLIGFGMILVVGFLLLVSFVLSAFVSAFGDMLGGYLGGAGEWVAQGIQIVFGLLLAWVLFAAIFKYLPDAEISWRDVWMGAFVTAVLFGAGRFAIGFYLGRNATVSAFGAAAAMAVLLIWIYYAAIILLLGAEFTQVWAKRHGRSIEPEAGAVKAG